MYIDPLYILLSLPALLIALGAQFIVRYFYSKYSRVANSAGLNGIDVTERLARENGLNIRLQVSLQDLVDSYNPMKKELTLSEKVAHAPSMASVGIAAHELGHAMQHQKGSFLLSIRTYLVPIVNLGTTLGYLLFILGFTLQVLGAMLLGIALFSFATVFTIVTLPVEIDASAKALKMLKGLNVFNENDLNGVRRVLFAAGFTYVASVLQSLSTLLYYVLRAFGRDD